MIDDEMPKGAVMMTQHLDLLVDEPLELAVALRRLAESQSTNRADWWKFAEKMIELIEELKALNEPPPKAA